MHKSKLVASQVIASTTCSAGLLAGLEQYGHTRGLDVKAEAASLGIDARCFGKADKRIEIKKVNQLFAALGIKAGDASFGLKFGQAFSLGHSGLLGMAMLNAPSAGGMLRFYAKVHELEIEQSFNMIKSEGDLYANYNLSSPLLGNIEYFEDFFSVLFVRHLRHHAGEDWAPAMLVMQAKKPEDTSEWDRIFRCKIEYGAPVGCSYYKKSINEAKNPTANVKLFELLQEEILKKHEEYVADLPLIARAQRAISARMLIGDCTIKSIARDIGVSERSFQRKLAASDLTFQQISHEVKRAVFYLSLAEKNKSLEEIALQCGYQSVSSFSRAVKATLDKSPSELRKDIANSDRGEVISENRTFC